MASHAAAPHLWHGVIDDARRQHGRRRRRIAATVTLATATAAIAAAIVPVLIDRVNQTPTLRAAAALLARTPYLGVHCPIENSTACDRVGLRSGCAPRPARSAPRSRVGGSRSRPPRRGRSPRPTSAPDDVRRLSGAGGDRHAPACPPGRDANPLVGAEPLRTRLRRGSRSRSSRAAAGHSSPRSTCHSRRGGVARILRRRPRHRGLLEEPQFILGRLRLEHERPRARRRRPRLRRGRRRQPGNRAQRGAAERARAGVGVDVVAVKVVAIVVATATPIAPPTCWLVLISPEATPASAAGRR